MRFVEAVRGEFLHQVEDSCCSVFRNSAVRCTCYKNLPLLGHFLGFFLTHGATQ